MKRFKELLKEFLNSNTPNRGGSNFGGGDPHEQVMRFMDSVPFRLNTRQGDLIHFDSALNAAKILSSHLNQHEQGHNHAIAKNIPHMVRYFQKSAATHERALDLLKEKIENHENLPALLRAHVGPALAKIDSQIQDEHTKRKEKLKGQKDMFGRPMDDIGGRVATSYGATPIEIQGVDHHPHQDDEMHHLEGVAGEIESMDDPFSGAAPVGYVKRRK